MFNELFEKMNEQEGTPEALLMDKIVDEIKGLLAALKGDYWFHEDTKFGETDVLNWIKENKPEFYKKAIIDPEMIEGSDVITNALEALGLMKEWHDVSKEELQTPEDIEYWEQNVLSGYDD